MKSVPKLIRRFVGILLFSALLLIALNILLFVLITLRQKPNASPWHTAAEAAQKLQAYDGRYSLPEDLADTLAAQNIWAVFIEDDTKQTVWQTDNLPEGIPSSYTLSDISALTRGYLCDYPVFTGASEYGLLVLGYPKNSFWKHMWPSWDYQLIADLPKTILAVLVINAAAVFLIYTITNTRLFASVKPITNGIQTLPSGKPVHVPEKGLLSELAANINRTSEILQSQSYQLRRKETARANWIAGVSHDIRTPLSMIMGCAGQLAEDSHLSEEACRKAAVIVKQSERMRNLIQDLNLASKLEYNMQPLHLAQENIVAIVRQTVVDFMNTDPEEKYPILWETSESLNVCFAQADKNLIRRAVGNLIQNCINHNEQGCSIYVCVSVLQQMCCVEISDNGCGMPDNQIEQLNHTPHYMICDTNTDRQQHGLGLLIVRQIAASHGGRIEIGRSPHGGFSVKMLLPILPNS